MLSTIGIAIVTWGLPDVAVRPILVGGFLLVCPGMALVQWLELDDALARWILALACSFVIDTAVAGMLVYAGQWSTFTALTILLITTVAVTGGQTLRQIMRARLLDDVR